MKTGVATPSMGESGLGRMPTSAASVCSAGTTSNSAGQLLKVITGATGWNDIRLRVAPKATDAGPRRSMTHMVFEGIPTIARRAAAASARRTTSSAPTSGMVAVTG
jgi:hypothetical protein